MTTIIVSSRVTSSGIVVTSGNFLTVESGGPADATFLSGGVQQVDSGGAASSTQVSSGGAARKSRLI